MGRLHAGTYPHSQEPPELVLTFEPKEPDGMVCTAATVDKGDHYALIYHCQNYGQRPCMVTAG